MSMLKAFFEIDCDKSLFEGLEIANDKDLCETYMGKFPVICITLKNAIGLTYAEACDALKRVIGNEARRFRFLAGSGQLDSSDKDMYRALAETKNGCFTMTDSLLADSLRTLSQLFVQALRQKCDSTD